MPTTNPVPSTDPTDLLFNAGKLDEVVNSTSTTYTDRLGVQRRTLIGLEAEFPNAAANAVASAASAISAETSATEAKNYADGMMQQRVYRNLRSIVDAAFPVSNLGKNVLLKKIRTDYPEFAVYTPITTDGIEWARWLFTNRLNTGLSGSTRLLVTTLAKLYSGSSTAAYAENQSSGTQAQAPIVTQGTSAATSRTGTWVGPATISGITDVIYSVTTGDKVVYSLTGVNRIALRAYTNSSNGGYASLVIKDSGGTEISSGYSVGVIGGYRRVNFRDQQNGNGLQYITLASELPTGNYTVELTVAADNPASGRLYDAGIFGYSTIAYNATGQQGIFTSSTIGTTTYRLAFYAGARVTYPFNGTKVSLRHGVSSNAGKINVKVYTSAGAEIAADKYLVASNTIDAYASSSTSLASTPVAGGLPLGDYYLVAESLADKNASSTGWRLFDYGIIAYNENQAGVLGVDSFDDLGVSSNYQSPSNIPAGTLLIGYGNLEQAISVRRATDAHGTEEFVGGIHGHETAMTGFSVSVGGSVIDYAGAIAGSEFIGSNVQIGFSTNLKFVDNASNWALSTFSLNLSSYGYSVTVKRDIIADAVIYKDYSLMLPVSSGAIIGAWAAKGVGGQFTSFAVDGDVNYYGVGVGNDSSELIDGPCLGAVAYNNQYAITGFNTNTAYRNIYEIADSSITSNLSLIQDRSDGVGKYYNIAFRTGATGTLILAGDTHTRSNVYRCVKGFVGGIVV